MSAITNCPKCGTCYEESSEEQANSPSRECMMCWRNARDDALAPARGIIFGAALSIPVWLGIAAICWWAI